ncbi:hypothetical protein ACPWSR_09395 [Alloiococcus sp. CFN-8]|uniref:hypothetical protein n=1 Tax=Alloiococcus sp. CFN-8 TaxID=3416081 RepID=UPI003CF70213
MKRKRSFSLASFFSAILAIIFLAGCGNNSTPGSSNGGNGGNNNGKDPVVAEPLENGKSFSSDDDVIEVTVPEDWEEIDNLNSSANLQIGNLQKEQYTIAISELASDFSDSFGLQEYYDAIIPPMQQNITNAEVSDIENVKIDGNDAIQFHLTGEVDNIKITYLITVIKSQDYFHQIISWTLKSMYTEYEDLYKSIAGSLTEK